MGNNPLIEAAFKFIVSILILPRYEEASASHGGKDIAFIVFAHLLGRNIVRIHPFDGAAYSKLSQVIILTTLEAVIFIKDINQFREGRSNVDTGFILDAFQTLLEDFLDDLSIFFNVLVLGIQMKEKGYERRLSISRHQGIDLVLDCLDTACQLFLHAGIEDFVEFLFTQ